MAIEYEVRGDTVHVRPVGPLTLDDLEDYFERAEIDPDVPHGFIEVIDLGGTTAVELSPEDIGRVGTLLAGLKEKKGIRATLFLAKSDLHFGMARMSVARSESVHEGLVYRTEKELAEAIERIRARS